MWRFAAGGLIVSVFTETALTGIRLLETGWRSARLGYRFLSLRRRNGSGGASLVLHVFAMIRRIAFVSSLLLADDKTPVS